MPRANPTVRPDSRNNSAQKVLQKPHNGRAKSSLSSHSGHPTAPNVGQQRRQSPSLKTTHLARANAKSGFTFASSAADDDDDDDWVSSESGAATPSGHDVSSDQAAGDVEEEEEEEEDSETQASTPVDRSSTLPEHLEITLLKNKHRLTAEAEQTASVEPGQNLGAPLRNPTHSPNKRQSSSSKPSSMISTKSDISNVRPHPLLRARSNGRPGTFPRFNPLPPLTVTTDEGSSDTSGQGRPVTDSSPSIFDPHLTRRPSVSSARSIATLPVYPTSGRSDTTLIPVSASRDKNRTRTLSTMSTSSSSAALSSLTRLPAVSRPPSPRTVCFFPVANPQLHLDAIHPLLPAPFLRTHLTTLATQQPLLESFHRVRLAKQLR